MIGFEQAAVVVAAIIVIHSYRAFQDRIASIERRLTACEQRQITGRP